MSWSESPRATDEYIINLSRQQQLGVVEGRGGQIRLCLGLAFYSRHPWVPLIAGGIGDGVCPCIQILYSPHTQYNLKL
jgi:Na+/citrate or Na+/malate symporter